MSRLLLKGKCSAVHFIGGRTTVNEIKLQPKRVRLHSRRSFLVLNMLPGRLHHWMCSITR